MLRLAFPKKNIPAAFQKQFPSAYVLKDTTLGKGKGSSTTLSTEVNLRISCAFSNLKKDV